ncbi:MAG: hypothetical protein GX616_17465 [Planctomycetes bacterium]|nr:hypothetical protein [Planctomycetota bacterium]
MMEKDDSIMNCNSVRDELLQYDWDEVDRQRLTEILNHLAHCDECRSAMADFDRLRLVSRPIESDTEPTGGWTAFEHRLIDRMTRPRRRLGWVPPALAASLALAVVGWGLYLGSGGTRDQRAPSVNGGEVVRALTPQEIADRIEVFDQVSEVFDRRAGWVLISDQRSDMGVGQTPMRQDESLLLVRLSLLKDRSLFSNADLVIVPGQMARVSVPSHDGSVVRYQVTTSETDPRFLRLRVEVGSSNGQREGGAALATDLRLPSGKIVPAGQLVTSSGSYDVHVGICQSKTPSAPL